MTYRRQKVNMKGKSVKDSDVPAAGLENHEKSQS
jgi:hypothetical protein